MFSKLVCYPDSLLEHEQLEILLYYAVPRTDTNPLAHKILKAFGSLEAVFKASIAELKTVEGVGDKVASLLFLAGEMARATLNKEPIYLASPEKCKEYVINMFKGEKVERFYLLLLDDKKKLIAKTEFTDKHKDSVSADIPELSRALYLHKPTYAIVTHNHPSGIMYPSMEDDVATKKINLLCSITGTTLADHIIYADKQAFSYRLSGRIEDIKDTANIDKMLKSLQGENIDG